MHAKLVWDEATPRTSVLFLRFWHGGCCCCLTFLGKTSYSSSSARAACCVLLPNDREDVVLKGDLRVVRWATWARLIISGPSSSKRS
eukprot:1156475-Pelagomonas_calceolata.AAC.8